MSEANAQNTPDLPYAERIHRDYLREGCSAISLAQNCSGKHAAILATCIDGWGVSMMAVPPTGLAGAFGRDRCCGRKIAEVEEVAVQDAIPFHAKYFGGTY